MRFGLHLLQENTNVDNENTHVWKAEMRDALQTIYFVISELGLERKNEGLQRVSLLAEHRNTQIKASENLKWDLDGLHVDPDIVHTLRNEFRHDAGDATIRLAKGSDPAYVIHNWYDVHEQDR